MRRLLAIALAIGLPAQALAVDKATNPATPVPAEAPHHYAVPADAQRSAARTRRAVALRHDRAWAERQRRAIHRERGEVLSNGN